MPCVFTSVIDQCAYGLKFKDGDGPGLAVHAETTDKLMVFASNGRFYTLATSTLPGGRGMGEPLRLMVDLPNEAEIIAMFPWREGEKYLVASKAGRRIPILQASPGHGQSAPGPETTLGFE